MIDDVLELEADVAGTGDMSTLSEITGTKLPLDPRAALEILQMGGLVHVPSPGVAHTILLLTDSMRPQLRQLQQHQQQERQYTFWWTQLNRPDYRSSVRLQQRTRQILRVGRSKREEDDSARKIWDLKPTPPSGNQTAAAAAAATATAAAGCLELFINGVGEPGKK
ncbi:hypothetical protein EAH_00056670 [Eimeria acervulina]|uniref:Uncharacterized protein n=1 Tax=Eimeria acervulina TaxID=5801 RepID=U6GL07_EIMAC|nr:hypothetical protein EAH_00056670 [Eimeria acervulina]CDI80855.1 hypothetical protein EAH_00056670 [Eimeria acervulina]